MKLTDLSQLTKAVLKKDEPQKPAKVAPKRAAIPHPQKVATVVEPEAEEPKLSREDAECLAYFSRTSLSDPRYAIAGRAKTIPPTKRETSAPTTQDEPATIAALKAKETQLTSEIAELKAALAAAETRVAEADARAAAAKQESEAHMAEIRTLRAKAAETPHVAAAPAPAPLSEPPASRARGAVLAPPSGFVEMFPGEVREMVLAALHDAADAAKQSTRERRAAVLEAVLRTNASSGELERRRSELKQILKDVVSRNDEHMLKGLEMLGMKLVSGKKHWKLEYGNVRMPLSKTPSDYRSQLNASADMANRCF